MTFNILIMVCAAAPYVVLRQPPGSEREGERERERWLACPSLKQKERWDFYVWQSIERDSSSYRTEVALVHILARSDRSFPLALPVDSPVSL